MRKNIKQFMAFMMLPFLLAACATNSPTPKPKLYWTGVPDVRQFQEDRYECLKESLYTLSPTQIFGVPLGDICELNNTIYSPDVLGICISCLQAKGYVLASTQY